MKIFSCWCGRAGSLQGNTLASTRRGWDSPSMQSKWQFSVLFTAVYFIITYKLYICFQRVTSLINSQSYQFKMSVWLYFEIRVVTLHLHTQTFLKTSHKFQEHEFLDDFLVCKVAFKSSTISTDCPKGKELICSWSVVFSNTHNFNKYSLTGIVSLKLKFEFQDFTDMVCETIGHVFLIS